MPMGTTKEGGESGAGMIGFGEQCESEEIYLVPQLVPVSPSTISLSQ